MKTIIQDFFNDVDNTFIQNHNSDVNHTGDQYRSNNLKILGNELIFVVYDIFGAYINLTGKRLEGEIYIYIDEITTYDFRLMIRRKSGSEYIYFQIHNGGLYIKDQVGNILMSNTAWSITLGWKKVSLVIEPDYIYFKTEGENIYLYTSQYSGYLVLDFYASSNSVPKINNLLLQAQDEDFSNYSNAQNTAISSLTIQEIWERYSEIEFKREIQVKRLGTNESYEKDYQNIKNLTNENLNMFEVCKGISLTLPNNTFSLGKANSKNAELNFASLLGEFNDEETVNSIFHGFLRHKTLVKIIDSFIDKITYSGGKGEVSTVSFEGFIDDRLCKSSSKGTETIIVTEILTTLLRNLTWGEIKASITKTNLDEVVYEIMARDEFIKFFEINAINIIPGYNATGLDKTKYEDSETLLNVLENLSIGHSIFYVRDGKFYYTSNNPTAAVKINLGISPERKIKIDKIQNGAKSVKDKLYWANSTEKYFMTDRKYNERYEFDIKGVVNATQKQNLLNYVGPRIGVRKVNFQIEIPFLPTLFLLDKITAEQTGSIQAGSWILDCSKLDEIILLDPITTLKLTINNEWKIVGIEHKGKTKTILTVEEVL